MSQKKQKQVYEAPVLRKAQAPLANPARSADAYYSCNDHQCCDP
jgi:hypothetical protein